MHCLNPCQNAVLDHYITVGDKVCCLYTCAEELSAKFKVADVSSAFRLLMDLGLLKDCGQTSAYAKLSPQAQVDQKNGYFNRAAAGRPGVVPKSVPVQSTK